MFIEPDFADIPPLKTASDDHPPANLKNGQGFLSRVCNLLWDTNRFDEILLVILKTILVHNRNKFSTDALLSFGERVNEAADLSAVLDLPTPRPKPVPFIRRQPPGSSHTFGTHVDLATLLDLTAELTPATTTFTPLSGVTPREMVITERTVPPGMVFEEQDFHASLTKLMKPRRLD